MRTPKRTREWMWAVAAVALLLGLLRAPGGSIFAMSLGGMIGCFLAPIFALKGMRRLADDLDRGLRVLPGGDSIRRRPTVLATAYVFIWFAWFLAGCAAAMAGTLLANALRV